MDEALLTALNGPSNKKLHAGLVEHFCVSGKLSPQRIRGVFMQAGIVSPKSDEQKDLLEGISQNIVFLNVFAAKNNSFKKPKSKKPRSPKRKVLNA